MNRNDKTQLITFYSYKGGVGRTMAIANAACQLANKHGLKVIAIDWDLEAPGLHYYFNYNDEELQNQPGLIDYIEDSINYKRGLTHEQPILSKYIKELKDSDSKKIRFGSVRFIPCGRTDAHYMERVQDLDWDRFYEEYDGFNIIETFKHHLRQDADIILIDARAGQSDIGTTPTIQVPDAVVILFCSNRQSLDGVGRIAPRLKHHELRKIQNFTDLRLLLVPSRVFPKEDRFNAWIEKDANQVYEKLLKEGVLNREDQPRGLRECILAVDPRFTFDEDLPILTPTSFKSDLKDAYVDLAQALANLHAGRELWSTHHLSVTQSPEPMAEMDKFREELKAAADRGDDHVAASLRFKLSQLAINQKKFHEAETMLQASLTYYQNKEDNLAISAIYHEIGFIRSAEQKFEEALFNYEKALKLKRELGDLSGQSVTLYEIGRVYYKQNKWKEAEVHYEQALELAKQNNNWSDQAITLQMLANVYRQQEGLLEKAEVFYKSALSAAEKINDQLRQSKVLSAAEEINGPLRQSKVLFEIGNLRRKQSRLKDKQFSQRFKDEAKSYYNRALDLAQQTGNTHTQILILSAIGSLLENKDNLYADAWPFYEKALKLAEQSVDETFQITITLRMAVISSKQSNRETADILYKKSLKLIEQFSDIYFQSIKFYELGIFKLKQGALDEAKSLYERALKLADQIKDRSADKLVKLIKYQLNSLHNKLIPSSGKLENLTQNNNILEQNRARIKSLTQLGKSARKESPEKAYDYFEKALALLEQVGDLSEQTKILLELGKLAYERNLDDPLGIYDKAFDRAKQVGDIRGQQIALYKKADILRNQNRPAEAELIKKQAKKLDVNKT